MNRKIIVFGATGKTGIQICMELERAALNYDIYCREGSADKIKTLSPGIKHGDVMHLAEVEKAFLNTQYTDVIISLGSKNLSDTSIRSTGTRNILSAMDKTHSTAVLHVISALGVNESWKQLKWGAKLMVKWLIKNAVQDHEKQENAVRSSTYKSHIIRPVGLRDGILTGEVQVQNTGFLPSNTITRNALAKFVVKSLLEGKKGVSGVCQMKN